MKETNLSSASEYSLSYNQRAMWYLNRFTPENDGYNVFLTVRILSEIDLLTLQRALQALVNQHAILRTTYIEREGTPVQQIHAYQHIDFEQIDASAWNWTDLQKRVAEMARQPFNLATGPVIRARLFTLSATDHVLLLGNHHIAGDRSTHVLFLEQFGPLYLAAMKGASPPKQSQADGQYLDYVDWQQKFLNSQEGERQKRYWHNQLKQELTPLDFPSGKPIPCVQRYVGAWEGIRFSDALFRRLTDFAEAEGVSLFTVLLSAFQALLYRYLQQEDISVWIATSDRGEGGFDSVAGDFINPLAIRADLTGNPTFRAFMEQVRRTARNALRHRSYPFPLLVEQLKIQRDTNRAPTFQAVFNMLGPRFHKGFADFFLPAEREGENKPTAVDSGGMVLTPFFLPQQGSTHSLMIELWQSDNTLRGFFKYNTDLFDAPTIARMVEHYQTLLWGIVTCPDVRLAELPLLTEAEGKQLLIDFNKTQTPSRHDACIHHLFEAQVDKTPNAVAVVFADEKLTYRELNARANQLAQYLQTLGVGPDTLVGVCAERSVEMIVSLLGVLKAGGGYVPLDPTYPAQRLTFMLDDAGISVLLTLSSTITKCTLSIDLEQLNGVLLDTDWHHIAVQSETVPESAVRPHNLAYAIYTSGSTGKPKGVLIEHRSLCNVIEEHIRRFKLTPSDNFLQFVSFSFDAANAEIFTALCTGATLVLGTQQQLMPGAPLLRFLTENRISVLTLTPSALAAMPAVEIPALHTIGVGGEACPPDLVAHWSKGRSFFNLYGPTEATICATMAECQDNGQTPSIGRPIANTQAYILNPCLQPVPIGVSGELHIGGAALARGYLNRPELTDARFIPNPFGDGRLYKTGDLACYRPDGNIEFLGRVDQQVKIRGYRIELGEIQVVLCGHPKVQEAVVIDRTDCSGDVSLVAYVVSHDAQPTVAGLRSFLKTQLPDYMVPSDFIHLDEIPRTPNGKTDHSALPTPNVSTQTDRRLSPSPRTLTEKRLAGIWMDILRRKQIGCHDSFFECGGHSLSATQLIYQIQEAFAVTLSIRRLYESPTIAQLAEEIDRQARPANQSVSWHPALQCLIALQTEGENPPFFCIHPVAGVVFPYYDLAECLGTDQPFYGLQSVGMADDRRPLTCLKTIARHYLQAMRTVQPKGPYFLGGWSFGAYVAFEMAQQLTAIGEHVSLLAVIDTPSLFPNKIQKFFASMDFFLLGVIPSIWPYVRDYFNLRRSPGNKQSKGRGPWSWNQSLSFQNSGHKKNDHPTKSQSPWAQLPHALRLLRVTLANLQAANSYVPQAYPGKITLFRTNQTFGKSGRYPDLGWHKFAKGGVTTHYVPGHHLDLLRKPHVQTMADILRTSSLTDN